MLTALHRRSRAAAVALCVPVTVVTALAVASPAGAASSTAAAPAAVAAPAYDRTSATEARRVDRVKVTLDWFDCTPLTIDGSAADCATATLPLDYDQPKGATTDVAVLRLKAKDQKNKIGTLFVNPGGPGGSGVQLAAFAGAILSPDLLDRFDVVGFDPRGTNLSDNVRCWKDLGAQATALKPITAVAFPVTQAETQAYVTASKAFGKACSTTGKPLSGGMSTAQVARDMDVLRRTLGDAQLNYLGFSYGTYLGATYANLFPDRLRALVVDGTIDPVAWAGTAATKGTPQTARLRSGEGGNAALVELLTRCGKAGPTYCSFAAKGDPVKNWAALTATLKAGPILDANGQVVIDYATLIAFLLGDLYSPDADSWVDSDLSFIWDLAHGDTAAVTRAKASLTARRSAAATRTQAAAAFRKAAKGLSTASRFAVNWPYDNSPEAYQSVLCTDGLNPADAAKWPSYAAANDQKAPGFGPLWTWASAPCATNTWTVEDGDAYRGPFTHRTVNPVLVVGSLWDPATNYQGAVTLSKLLPNSRLLSNDNWGHTAYGTSACNDTATAAYLLTQALPAAGTVCTGDHQPYTQPLDAGGAPAPSARSAIGSSRTLPPIPAMVPGVVPMR